MHSGASLSWIYLTYTSKLCWLKMRDRARLHVACSTYMAEEVNTPQHHSWSRAYNRIFRLGLEGGGCLQMAMIGVLVL